MYYYVEPEVNGELGPKTEMNRSVHPPDIDTLHVEIKTWLGDDLLEVFPSFLISETLETLLESSDITGYEIDEVETSTTNAFAEFHPDMEPPAFQWLQITGEPGDDDFGLSDDHRLVISETVLSLLQESHDIQFEHADIEPFE